MSKLISVACEIRHR